jgi:hypothetical protein
VPAGSVPAGSVPATSSVAEPVPVHIVGCARRCGSPTAPHVEALITGDAVELRGGAAPRGVPITEAASVIAETAAVIEDAVHVIGESSRLGRADR